MHTRAPVCPEHAQIETTRCLRGREGGGAPELRRAGRGGPVIRMGVSGWPPRAVHPARSTRSGRGTGPTSRNHQSDPAPAAGLGYGIRAPGPTSRHQGHVHFHSPPHKASSVATPGPRPPGRASRDSPAAQTPSGPVLGTLGREALTLWPFSPGSPARPSKPRSPCERTGDCSETVPLPMTARLPRAPGPSLRVAAASPPVTTRCSTALGPSSQPLLPETPAQAQREGAYLGAGLSGHASCSVAASPTLDRRAKRQTNEASPRRPPVRPGQGARPHAACPGSGAAGTSRLVLVPPGLALSRPVMPLAPLCVEMTA